MEPLRARQVEAMKLAGLSRPSSRINTFSQLFISYCCGFLGVIIHLTLFLFAFVVLMLLLFNFWNARVAQCLTIAFYVRHSEFKQKTHLKEKASEISLRAQL